MHKIIKILTVIVTLLIIAGAVYWYFVLRVPTISVTTGDQVPTTGFIPFDRDIPASSGQDAGDSNNGNTTSASNVQTTAPLPILRLLSATPVGGYGASTTASTTVVRWVDRGRGNIYEARGDRLDITTISNTLLPRVYESWWNKNDTSFVGQYLSDKGDEITTVIANIQKRVAPTPAKTGTSTSVMTETIQNQQVTGTIYELKGKVVSGNIIAVASSPKRDRILVINNDNGRAIGYVSNFDGSKQTQLFDLPFTQLVAEWPEENTIAITTKAGANYSGYLYFVNVKTGVLTQILGNMPGLATKVSKDAIRVLYSSATKDTNMTKTIIYEINTGKSTEMIFRTFADKCVWSSKFKEEVYCALPSKITTGIYPDDWYLGKVSFIDDIWLLNSTTGQIHRVSKLLSQANQLIDVFNIELDTNGDFLYFMNKNNLSLWSLDLVSSN